MPTPDYHFLSQVEAARARGVAREFRNLRLITGVVSLVVGRPYALKPRATAEVLDLARGGADIEAEAPARYAVRYRPENTATTYERLDQALTALDHFLKRELERHEALLDDGLNN